MESKNINCSPGENPHPIPPVAIEDEYSNNCIKVDEASKSGKKTLKRKRELRSKVWDHFERVFINDSAGEKVTKMKCTYCATLIKCDSKYVNENCVKRDTGDIGQMLFGNEHGSMLMRSSKFTEEKFCELLICAALMHNLPLSFVKYSGIKDLLSYLKVDVPAISRNTAKIDMVKLHRREKNKIKFMLDETPGRKRILNFSYMPPPLKAYNKLYGRDSREFKSVKESLFSLYNAYADKVSPIGHTSSTYMNVTNDHTSDSDDLLPTGIKDVFQEFDTMFGGSKSELEMYLNEQRVNRKTELDILQYWKEKQYHYPKLAAMARDILSIPISTVSSKSASSVGGRVVDQYQSSLKPEILEGIVCCKDWLAGDLEPVEMELNVITEDMKYESTPVQGFTKLEVPLP